MKLSSKFASIINPFLTNVPLLYSLKTSAKRRFSDVFMGYRSGTWFEMGKRIYEY